MYWAVATALLAYPLAMAIASRVLEVVREIAAAYLAEDVVGVVPFVV